MKITWVFDFISPFSYLALKELETLPTNADVTYLPVLFAGLLNHHGQIGNAEIESKRRFTYRFCLWKAQKMGIPMRMPPAHPFNSLTALRLVIAAGGGRSAIERVFDAIFRDGKDVADPRIAQDLAEELNVPGGADAANDAAVKQALRENTDWAIARGIFGVPTILIGEELFWGHDATEMARDYFCDPSKFATAAMKAIDTLPIGAVRPARARSL
jgi:2-hydroxychromene-2-carboxylate isomerase